MSDQVHLFHELLKKSEKYLVPLGVWPSSKNNWITLCNIIILCGYSVLVLIKNLKNPERESIENAFTLANGGLITVAYFITVILKKEKLEKFFTFIKTERKEVNNESKKLLLAGGKEYQRISTAFLYILPAAVLVRFLQPPLEYAYIQLFKDDKTFDLPPAMGIPTFLFGEITTYIIESIIRMIMLSTLMGVCTIFILSTLYICTQFNILTLKLENFNSNNEDDFNKLIRDHQELLNYTGLLNEIFSPYFFADCLFSLINLSIMMFSLIAHNAHIENFLMEGPLVTAGMSQLFFVLYFGDRLIHATSQISNGAYNTSWFAMSISTQKKISFMIMRGQRAETLNFGGKSAMVASILLFSQICQRAYSAFNILRTTI